MIQKRVLSNFISKYHLNGLIEKVQWTSDTDVKMGFVNDSKTLLGYVTLKDINFPKGKLGIFDTGKLNKMLNILDGELLIDIKKTNGIPAKLNLEDTNYSISCNLADPSVIPSLPQPTIPPTPASKFEITQEFINRFIRYFTFTFIPKIRFHKMSYYNKLKQIITYLNFLFGIYIWILIIYAFFRYTDLIKSSPLGNFLLMPLKMIISIF